MPIQKRPLLSAVLLTAAATAQAADLPQNVIDELRNNPQSIRALEEVQKEERENRQKIRVLEEMQKEDAAWKLKQNTNPQAQTPEQTKENESEQTCLPNQTVQLTGITLIDAKKITVPECVNTQTLNQLSRDLTAAYIQAGFAGTQIDFEQSEHAVVVKIREAKIREITGGSRTVNIATLFPNHKDKPVSIRYLDQGIEQANKLSGNNVSMDIYPNSDGTASVELKNEESKHWFGQVTVDNKGSKPNKAVARATFGIASPFGLSDSLYIGGYSNTAQGNDNYSRGANLFYSVPYGAWTFSTYASTSRSRSVSTLGSGRQFNYDSETVAAGVKGERVLSRGQKHITYAHLGVDYLNTLSEFGGSKIAMQSPKLGVVQTGITHSQTLNSGVWISDFAIERGTGLFGAKDSELSPFSSHFTNFVANTTLMQNRRVGEKWILRNQHRLSAQHSEDNLYSTKQFSIAERSAVRGFNNLTLNGTSGAYLTNTVYARRYLPNNFYVEPYLGIDGGAVKDDDGWHRAFGGAVGINFAYDNKWQVNVESARGIAYPKGSDKIRQEQITASIRVMF